MSGTGPKATTFDPRGSNSILNPAAQAARVADVRKKQRRAAFALVRMASDPQIVEDLLLDTEFDDAMDDDEALGGIRGKRIRGKRIRGGGKGKDAAVAAESTTPPTGAVASSEADLKAKVQAVVAHPTATPDQKKEAIVTIVAANKGLIGGIIQRVKGSKNIVLNAATFGAVVTALNKPTFYGNLVQVVGSVLRTGLDRAITSTWQDWGDLIVIIGREVGLSVEAIGRQTMQGPVVPFAIATMYIAYLGYQENKTITQVIAERSRAIFEAAKTFADGQAAAFRAAYLTAGNEANAARLKDIAKRVKQNVPSGEGAQALTDAVRSSGAPAIGAPSGVVQGMASPAPIVAVKKLTKVDVDALKAKQDERIAAAALITLGDAVDTPAPTASAASASAAAAAASAAPASDVPMGRGRRRRATKKRGPRRRVTRRMPRFAY